jgi:hypothetical protein
MSPTGWCDQCEFAESRVRARRNKRVALSGEASERQTTSEASPCSSLQRPLFACSSRSRFSKECSSANSHWSYYRGGHTCARRFARVVVNSVPAPLAKRRLYGKVRVETHGVPALRKESTGAKRGFPRADRPVDFIFFRKALP